MTTCASVTCAVLVWLISPWLMPAVAQNGLIQIEGTTGASSVGVSRMSADGTTWIGQCGTPTGAVPVRWTSCGGSSVLPLLAGASAGRAAGINADGTVVVGDCTVNGLSIPCYWDELDRVFSLPLLEGDVRGIAVELSDDGRWCAGTSYSGSGVGRSVRWDLLGGVLELGPVSGASSQTATAISADGRTIVGTVVVPGNLAQGFIWREGAGIQMMMPVQPLWGVSPRALSADGSLVFGDIGQFNPSFWFRWTPSGGFETLAVGWDDHVGDVSADGSIVMGSERYHSEVIPQARRWTASGSQEVVPFLASQGVDTVGWELLGVSGMSQGGDSFVGYGRRGGAWIAWAYRPATAAHRTPVIRNQPSAAHAAAGAPAEFEVYATRGPTDYQWRKDGTPLLEAGHFAGTRSPRLQIASVSASEQGMYDCLVFNECGPATSVAASLSCRPRFELQPSGGTLMSGTTVVLTAAVSGQAGTTFRWRRDGVALFNSGAYSGVTTPSLTIRLNDPGQSGQYQLFATNSCGTTSSEVADVDVVCGADFNNDGAVDGDDVIGFFTAWDAGDLAGDYNTDGSVDGDDVIGFFGRWDVGC